MSTEKILILPDCHIGETTDKVYKVVKKYIKQNKFDEIILLGDFMDVNSLSAWDYDKKRLMEGKRFQNEVKNVNNELDFLAKYTKKITYLEGNHENRIERYLDKNPEMEGMIEVQKVLNLEERCIKYIKMNELYKKGSCYFTHGMYTNKYHANKHMTMLGCNIVYGHSHRPQVDTMNMKMQKPITSVGLGCLCEKAPDYMKGRPAQWQNQFAVVYLANNHKDFNLYPTTIVKNKFIIDGKLYK